MRLDITTLTTGLKTPFVSASGSTDVRELLLVRLEDDAGVVGFGEAAPLPSYDGVTAEHAHRALEDCRDAIEAADGRDRTSLLNACADRAVLPQAIAAIDMALWDLAGQRANQPVWRLLGAPDAEPLAVNATIAAADRAGAAAAASRARAQGFSTIKVKVGLGDDAGRLAAIRAAAGRDIKLRLDANGAWSVAQAAATLKALEPVEIELCEEPVTGLEETETLSTQTAIPIAIDETSALPGALERRVCTAVCLKISRCGGITGTLDAAARARAAGYEIYLSSTLDGPLGIAAALHAAAALVPDRPCGLATLSAFAQQTSLPAPKNGSMAPPNGAGLGADLISFYRAG